MPERPTERQVLDWLSTLGRLVAANMPAEEASTRLRAYTPELLARYDSRDFNQVSREFVARHCKFFPSYGELCELLDKWPKPAERPLPKWPQQSDIPEAREPPTEEEKAAVHEAVQRAIAGMTEARLEMQQRLVHRGVEAPPKPPKDVTMKGEELRKSRLARGLKIPEPTP